jgi:hypothetical protein
VPKQSLSNTPQLPSPLLPAPGSALRHPTNPRAILPLRSAARLPASGRTKTNARLPAYEPPRSPLPERGYRTRRGRRAWNRAIPIRLDRRRH